MEDWKEIPSYEGLYKISTLGNVSLVVQGKRRQTMGIGWEKVV